MKANQFSMYREMPGMNYGDAVERVTAALQEEGFGILTEIDVKATLKKKIDADFRPYVILGACNPHLAHRALMAEPEIGVMLPCNVVVAETEAGSEVLIARPQAMMELSESEAVRPIADEAEEKLTRVLAAL